MGSDTDDKLYNLAAAVQRKGNLNRAYVNGNENGVKLNWNWTDNQWNRNCRFVAVCNSSHACLAAGRLPRFIPREFRFEAVCASHPAFFQFRSEAWINEYIFCYQVT